MEDFYGKKDCSSCDALCCVSLDIRSLSKDASTPCKDLKFDKGKNRYLCSIYYIRLFNKFKVCRDYDCVGAGNFTTMIYKRLNKRRLDKDNTGILNDSFDIVFGVISKIFINLQIFEKYLDEELKRGRLSKQVNKEIKTLIYNELSKEFNSFLKIFFEESGILTHNLLKNLFNLEIVFNDLQISIYKKYRLLD
jgi:hypothetical protein